MRTLTGHMLMFDAKHLATLRHATDSPLARHFNMRVDNCSVTLLAEQPDDLETAATHLWKLAQTWRATTEGMS